MPVSNSKYAARRTAESRCNHVLSNDVDDCCARNNTHASQSRLYQTRTEINQTHKQTSMKTPLPSTWVQLRRGAMTSCVVWRRCAVCRSTVVSRRREPLPSPRTPTSGLIRQKNMKQRQMQVMYHTFEAFGVAARARDGATARHGRCARTRQFHDTVAAR